MEFYFCKFCHQCANISWIIYQINLYMSNTLFVYIFCGLISHISFTTNGESEVGWGCHTPTMNRKMSI